MISTRTFSVLVAFVALASIANAGVHETPLPTFGDGKGSQLLFVLPALVKNNALETAVICTNLAPGAINLGVELFDSAGTQGNSVATGIGAVLDVAPGHTVTFATGSTAVLHEDVLIALDAGVTTLAQGSGRVVGTSPGAACVAFAVDSVHTVQDPAVCPGCKAPTITNLPALTPCSPTACDDGNPCTSDGCDAGGSCTHTPVTDATPCDDGDACTTDDVCGAGVCHGSPLMCMADTPCHLNAVCEPGSGQCMEAAPFSVCTPGGGKKTSDCAAEWVVENPSNPRGRASIVQVCRQGDPTCDFDVDARACRFLVRVCLNNRDVDLPACRPGRVSLYELRQPTPASKKPHERAGATTVLDAVAALGPSARGGKRQNRIAFDPPDMTGDHCTPALPLRVPLGRRVTLRTRAATPDAPADTDRLKLKCARPPRK